MAAQTFAIGIERFAKKFDARSDRFVRKVLFDVGTSLVLKSPVGNPSIWKINAGRSRRRQVKPKGYVGGRFRANWFYGTDIVPRDKDAPPDRSGRSTLSRIQATVPKQHVFGHMHWFANNLPYARRLEDGWSKQAPQGMVKLTAMEFVSFANKAAAEA